MAPQVIDIRAKQAASAPDLCHVIADGLAEKVSHGDEKPVRHVPSLVLYDAHGLEIYDQITYLDDYYLTNAEIDILASSADAMLAHVKDGDILIELGVGSMRKTSHVLDAIVRAGKRDTTYYAVDVSEESLTEALAPLVSQYPTISFVGLFGTYDDSLAWLRDHAPRAAAKTFLWLGSTIGNVVRTEAAAFLRSIQETAMVTGDHFIVGIDRRKEGSTVQAAYNDPSGLHREFVLNSLSHMNHLFNAPVFDRSKFEHKSIYNDVEGRHEAHLQSLEAQTIHVLGKTIGLEKNELIHVAYSHKYSEDEMKRLVQSAGLHWNDKFADSQQRYDVHLFSKA
ncbi:hypothetical protein SDRG_14111 [Saprolegnia diclina VS20]|uniref:4-dimethylallyltryptophan N-methyltransferase n=1 Tax=Saprolegnia diclina (strain VS20) TaxID=1156394 RepID=T0PRN4_SAPDV|nr:hypothetical protein SDRG_14111 [Saprolegnia diclina VS20]EQC28154.1 hypothetical protein SDRG_14111 [Saprolegnia diclina VS20]|eukprot:XP_008618440.1 hypothetical protein SDRG_14111 [Saprolegnia diclina VS20]